MSPPCDLCPSIHKLEFNDGGVKDTIKNDMVVTERIAKKNDDVTKDVYQNSICLVNAVTNGTFLSEIHTKCKLMQDY